MDNNITFFGKAIHCMRSDSLENWENKNPVLLRGEAGAVISVDETNGEVPSEIERIKIGDGIRTWNELPWWKGPKGDIGPQGPQGDIGPQGPKGDAGSIKFIPLSEKPPEVATDDMDLMAIYLAPTSNIENNNMFDEYVYVNGRREKIGSASVEINLDEYVKNTDYATQNKAGVVKLSGYYGVMAENGILRGTYVSSAAYPDKHINLIISKGTLDAIKNQYVKEGLTANTETLTAEEKASACDWLGINTLAILKTISGSYKNISVGDVSPLNHKCFCKLTSDTYTSGGSNNIFETTSTNPSINDDNGSDVPNLTTIRNEDGSITIKGYTNCRAHIGFNFYGLTVGKTYTFSLRDSNGVNTLGEYAVVFRDENNEFIRAIDIFETTSHTFTVPENTVTATISFDSVSRYEEFGDEPFDLTVYPQLEEGSTMTDWVAFAGAPETKPYIEDLSTVKLSVNGTEYTPNIDGTVEFMSESPTMEITTDNEHANIVELNYCVDTKKYVDDAIGDVETALDNIIAIQERTIALQESLIGGDVE